MVRMDDTGTGAANVTDTTSTASTTTISIRFIVSNTTTTEVWTGTNTGYTYTNYRKKEDDKSDYKEDAYKAMREGWYNPKKMPITAKGVKKNINLKIRNQLPYKMREVIN